MKKGDAGETPRTYTGTLYPEKLRQGGSFVLCIKRKGVAATALRRCSISRTSAPYQGSPFCGWFSTRGEGRQNLGNESIDEPSPMERYKRGASDDGNPDRSQQFPQTLTLVNLSPHNEITIFFTICNSSSWQVPTFQPKATAKPDSSTRQRG